MKGSIKYVNSIRVIKDDDEGDLLAIKAKGITEIILNAVPKLVPSRYKEVPVDGIYELDFKLDDCREDISSVAFEVEVILSMKKIPGWVKAIKVNADENSDIEVI